MNERTKEDIALAFVAATATFIITYITIHYAESIRNAVR